VPVRHIDLDRTCTHERGDRVVGAAAQLLGDRKAVERGRERPAAIASS